ncbi:MAG: hypothetical protein Q7W51_01570 [Coriobacteriia bacterium]|nr:hypothetical protein [Coriobacteriia bacterium]
MKRRWTTRIAAIVIGALMLATMAPVAVPSAAASAAPFAIQQARVFSGITPSLDGYATSVAISGNLMAVGSPDLSNDQGAVYVYKRTGTTWSWVETLYAAGVSDGDEFGKCVAMDGNRLVVGAPHHWTGGGPVGVAFVYTWNGTTFGTPVQLSGETIAADERYGEAVAIDGDTLVVGAPLDGTAGSAWPYRWNGASWINQGTLNGSAGDALGWSVAIAGDTILASATGRDNPVGPLVDAGSFMVFTRTGAAWSYQQRLYAPDPKAGAFFGSPIDMSGSGYTALIGAPNWDAGAGDDNTGRAYMYARGLTSWAHSQTLANPGTNSPDGDYFGTGVALDGDRLALVGAFWDDSHLGAGYYYTRTSGDWGMSQKISMSGTSPAVALFGRSVDMDNGTTVVGAPTSGNAGPPLVSIPGSAFVYSTRATITGICRNAQTGLPMAGVEVQAHYLDAWGDASPASEFVVSGADGRYTLTVDSGRVYVNFLPGALYEAGWYNDVESWPEASPIDVWAGNTYNVDFTIYPKFSVFRFFNVTNNTHFFTDSLQEKNMVLATWPAIFRYEGIAYTTNPALNLQPLYRFYNRASKSHFYTASLDEANHVIATWSHIFTYDGPTYSVSPIAGAGMSPVYRFYNVRNGSHFYTASAQEADMVIATWPDVYRFEGPAFWVGGSF